MRERIVNVLMRRQVAGVILFLLLPTLLLNDLGRQAFIGYYLGVLAAWFAYAIALRAPNAGTTPTISPKDRLNSPAV